MSSSKVSSSSSNSRRRETDRKTDKPAERSREIEKSDKPEKEPVKRKNTNVAGPYIPPAKLRMMREAITDKAGEEYQRMAWEALKKSIHGLINKVNASNLYVIVKDLFRENIIRGRGLLCRSLLQAQSASPTFTNVYAAFIAVINSKFPTIGELLVKRLVLQFKKSYRRNDKATCLSTTTFIAHLVNQRMLHEVIALQILMLLVDSPTDDSVEIAISFLKESGEKLTEVSSKGINAIFDTLRYILHDNKVDKRVQYMIEVVFQVRKDRFKDHPAVVESLDLIEEDDQYVHLVTLDDALQSEDMLNVFKFDPNYLETEKKYKTLCQEILGSDDEEEGSDADDEDDSDSEDDENDPQKSEMVIRDETETNLVAFRKTIYLTIQSSLDYQECAHKLLKMQIKPGQEVELCHMFLDCCTQQRTYEKFFGLLAQRFCQLNRAYIEPFCQIFDDSYQTIHRLDMNRLRNVAKFYAHLLFSNSIPWTILSIIRLNEEDTSSSSRIFIKILFQELTEFMGLASLKKRILDPDLEEAFDGIFPRDNPKNTRFAINFFTSIGLGGLTDELRAFLKAAPSVKKSKIKATTVAVKRPKKKKVSSSSSSSSSSTSSSSSSSSSDSDSDTL